MRVWIAGCSVMFMMLTVVAVLGERGFGRFTGIAVGLLMVLSILATFVFDRGGVAPVRELDTRSYRALRAFQVAEFEDEGAHYFLELEDRSILFVTGQYLYDYEPLTDLDDEPDQPRRFPCTEFTIRFDAKNGYTVDVLCGGTVLEPEVVAPHFTNEDYRLGVIPADREILTNPTYDELKATRLRRA